MTSLPLLRATDLAAVRGVRLLFSELSFAVAPGEILRVEGRNGAGKTTLLRILCGLDQDYEGALAWLSAAAAGRPWREDVLYLGHAPGLKSALTPMENLIWLFRLRGLPMQGDRTLDECARAALAQTGLAGYEDVPVATLSAGQQRRVALARLHLEQAPAWILDEPFTAIDPAGIAALEVVLQKHVQAGGAVVMTTHHPLAIRARSLRLGPLP